MKTFKKILLIALAALMVFTAAACGKTEPAPASSAEETSETSGERGKNIPSKESEEPESGEDDETEATVPETESTALETEATVPETEPEETATKPEETEEALLDPDGSYDSKEEVALYIHQYGCLPGNYISKKEAEKLGWSGGSLERYAPGKCIGGSRFGNYEGLLPEAKGRSYTECDIDTLGAKSRGAKRIVFSNDGLIFYTEDHYESFEQLY